MPRADPSLDLLVADVARALGRADAGQIAEALRAGLGVPAGERRPLEEVLAETAGWDAPTLAEVRREAERLVEEADGSVRRALIRRGGPTASLVPQPSPTAADDPPGMATGSKAWRNLREITPGRYSEFDAVGEGGMGIVYWAVDTELNRQVAFKIVRPRRTPPASA